MKKYDTYKGSGIEWIGEIPAHWKTVRGDNVFRLHKVLLKRDDLNGQQIYHYSIPSIQESDGPSLEDGSTIDSDKYQIIGSKILFSKLNPRKGTVTLSSSHDEVAVASTEFVILEPLSDDIKFCFYSLSSEGFKSFVSSLVESATKSHQRANPSDIYKSKIAIPYDLGEQTAIARYLDRKTAEIDELIADKKRLLELYEEEKTALINQAVTQGLDPNVPMKDSGIEWIGEIPAHWGVKRLKYMGVIKYGLGQPPKQKIDGLPIIRATNIFRGRINGKDMIFVDPDDVPYERDPILKTNDIIIVRSGAYTADSAIIPEKYNGAVTGYDMVFRCHENHFPKFLGYCFLSDYILKRQLIMHSLRAAQPHLNREELGETIVLVPSTEEQQAIVHHIETELSRIDLQVSRTQKLIDLLTEYRTALISEVVTGKVKVTD